MNDRALEKAVRGMMISNPAQTYGSKSLQDFPKSDLECIFAVRGR
jgi:hypothetical protein